ncbi:hypothetical protein HHI36_013093 [Cryptolaemus montrouzieri]|uniref:Uncharacterized protein n=1 Tax=Cryptolaemus montrouzieri TaxID=559131 RepID=A0ABD2NGH3_9CUCU
MFLMKLQMGFPTKWREPLNRASNELQEEITLGSNPRLTSKEEGRIDEWIFACQNKVFNACENPFLDNEPDRSWNRAVSEFKRENTNSIIRKTQFASVLKTAIGKFESDFIRNGLKACELYPWNPSVIDLSQCLKRVGPLANVNTVDNKPISHNNFVGIVSFDKVGEFRTLTSNEKIQKDTKKRTIVRRVPKRSQLLLLEISLCSSIQKTCPS